MSDFAKRASPISALVHATTSTSAHLDHLAPSPAPTPALAGPSSSRFRQSPSPTATGEAEFSSFAAPPPPPRTTTRSDRVVPDTEPATRGARHDGLEVAALLDLDLDLDDRDRDWEPELLARHRHRDHAAADADLPTDPVYLHRQGDLSPTSHELVDALSELDPASVEYLETTLLALPEVEAVARYLADARYSDDVWAATTTRNDRVRDVLDRVVRRTTDEGEGATGNETAVRRLGLLIRHLQLATAGTGVHAKGKGKGKAVAVDPPSRDEDRAGRVERAQAEWAQAWAEYPIAAAHVRSPPRSYFEKNLPPLSPPPAAPGPQTAPVSPFAHAPEPPLRARPPPSVSQPFSVPSSLSSEAFVVHGYSEPDDGDDGDGRNYPEGVYHEVPSRSGK